MTEGIEKGNEKIVTENTITTVKTTIGNTPIDGVYAWNQLTGQKASSSGNIYGIYDLSGGCWERTTGYVANGHSSLKTYGASLAYNGNTLETESTKYTTVYSHDTDKDNNKITNIDTNLNIAGTANYLKNTKIYGNAIYETSTYGSNNTSWNGEYSNFYRIILSIFSSWK